MALNPLQQLQTPSSPSASGVSVSVPVDVSTAIRSAAQSGDVNSSGTTYQTGAFTVGGGGNNMIFILAAAGVALFYLMKKGRAT